MHEFTYRSESRKLMVCARRNLSKESRGLGLSGFYDGRAVYDAGGCFHGCAPNPQKLGFRNLPGCHGENAIIMLRLEKP